MHPAAIWWLKRARQAAEVGGCEASMASCRSGRTYPSHEEGPWQAQGYDGLGGPFGVRRPLRFLAYKLDLDEKQVAEVAKILDDLKTERAQASVDERRTASVFADALELDVFDPAKVGQAAAQRVATAERLKEAVTRALARIHGVLQPDQRAHLATLLRTGVVTI